MRKMKSLIILLILLVIFIILILIGNIFRLRNQSSNEENYNNQYFEEDIEDDSIRQDTKIELKKNSVKEESYYVMFSINDAIQQLFQYIKENDSKAIYGITDKEFIREKNVTIKNIKLIYDDVSENTTYYIQELYKLENYEEAVYYTYGLILDRTSGKLKDYYLKIKIKNNMISIAPLVIDVYNEAKNGNITDLETISIDKNEYNNYEFKNFTSREISTRYINDYILKLQYKTDIAYELLDEDYRVSNFNDVKNFTDYIKQNKKRFVNFEIKTLRTEIKENSIEYIIEDTFDNYYKVIVYNAMDYKVILER